MKATKLLLATALFAGLATLSFAGPGPQFWAQQAKNAQERNAKTVAPAATQPAPQVACANCNCAGMKKS